MNETTGLTGRLKEQAACRVRQRIQDLTIRFEQALRDHVGANSFPIVVTFDNREVGAVTYFHKALEALETALFKALIEREEQNTIDGFLKRVREMSKTINELEGKNQP